MLIRCFYLCTVLVLLTGVCNAGLFPSPDSPEEQKLAEAISSGDLSTVESAPYLRDVSAGLKDYVLRNGTAETVRYINSVYELNITPLQIAVIENDRKAVKCLFPRLGQRPRIAFPRDHHSPLQLAIRKQNVPMVKLLIEQNMPVHEHVETFKPREKLNIVLSAAIHEGNAKIVRLLVDAGSQLEEPQSALVPVPGATHNGQPVSQLLSDLAGQPLSLEWQSLIYKANDQHLAAEKKKLFQELLAKGLVKFEDFPNAINANHGCPLADAISARRAKVVEVLLEAGANPNISIGGIPNLGSSGHTYPLHLASGSGHPGIVKLLIDAGADVNQLDSEGDTPLNLGYYHGDIADMLRAAGAKTKQKQPTEKKVEWPNGGEIEIKPDSDEDGNKF